ncbi:MAG: nickel-type superoxide dismutase maturation protease [Gemmatimonadetes bacterium]|nr:MAG: nickel-type superoxide dismutase maturation protease [Gemmatimonadota bacterium]
MMAQLPEVNLWELGLWIIKKRERLRVTGSSMLPLLKPGDEVLVNPAAYRKHPPQAGDLVVAVHPRNPHQKIIKRITTISPQNTYFIQGDNPAESTDSRHFGAVPGDFIIGKVTCRFG